MSFASEEELKATFAMRHGPLEKQGWSPRMKAQFGYFSPDVYYETVVSRLVTDRTIWLDLGCGADLFPSNLAMAKQLAARTRKLVGVDPSVNILKNPFLHAAFQGFVDEYKTSEIFDLITMRMVAEHVETPKELVREFARLVGVGGRVVVYTVNYWSLVTFISAVVPFLFHHPIKRLFWGTKEEDTFPVAYKMNTRKSLRKLFADASFEEESFAYLSDCRTLGRWRVTHIIELIVWRVLQTLGITYPENCLLGIYVRR